MLYAFKTLNFKLTLPSLVSDLLSVEGDWCKCTTRKESSEKKLILLVSWKPLKAGPGSIIQSTDPRIWIRIRMSQIQNIGCKASKVFLMPCNVLYSQDFFYLAMFFDRPRVRNNLENRICNDWIGRIRIRIEWSQFKVFEECLMTWRESAKATGACVQILCVQNWVVSHTYGNVYC